MFNKVFGTANDRAVKRLLPALSPFSFFDTFFVIPQHSGGICICSRPRFLSVVPPGNVLPLVPCPPSGTWDTESGRFRAKPRIAGLQHLLAVVWK